ncbi:diaminopimelate decarboxylase [Yunchengibacter salinarum]|uniref:diaminopimelate decarboxylase n=1 Tax=Yunchengibacter salinarum TaxID=3133399 RepID=UPI0035B5BDB7
MDHFHYHDGTLMAESVPLATIAETVGTPVYVYSTATLQRHMRVFQQSFEGLDALVCFAVKANSNQAVLKTLANEGAGADVVSAGELKRALMAGIPADRIVFSGVGKTDAEIRAGLAAGIKQFNVESEPELTALDRLAGEMGVTAPVSIRVNPDVDARTHAKISTGKAENKFGIPWNRADTIYDLVGALPNVRAVGVDVHIGSQLTDLAPFEAAFKRVVGLVRDLKAKGHAISHIDLGGGLGIPYEPDADTPPEPAAYGAMIRRIMDGLDCAIILEPGRLIAGNAGVLVTRLLYVKTGDARTFYVLDAAMNDLARPAMYDAYHAILPVAAAPGAPVQTVDFVGPICETGDTFATGRATAVQEPGALFAIKSAGAYGAVMASSYNTRALVPEVLVNGDRFEVVRPRVEVEDLIAMDRLPDWL